MERAIDDGVNSFKALTRDARVLPAGGAVELELSKALFEFGRKQTGLDQYAIAKFALALEVEPSAAPTAMQKLRIVTLGISGWGIAHDAVTRRPPISLDTMVPRTEGYAYDVGVWDLFIVQGPFSVAPCPTLVVSHDSQLFHRCTPPGTIASRDNVCAHSRDHAQLLHSHRVLGTPSAV